MKPLITPIPAHVAGDSPRAVLRSLKERGAAILVDERNEPVGVLTYSDMARLTEVFAGASTAGDLFERGRVIYTVCDDESPLDIARKIMHLGLKTGIVAVDRAGTYVGYVFVRDLRGLADEVRSEQQRVQGDLENLRKEHPAPFERVQRILKPGSKKS